MFYSNTSVNLLYVSGSQPWLPQLLVNISQCLERASAVTTWEGHYWHLVGRGHEFYKTSSNKQGSAPKIELFYPKY